MPMDCSLGEALRLFQEHLREAGVSPQARARYAAALHGPLKRMILCALPEPRRTLPLESLLLSQIPRPLIHDCMHSLRSFCLRIARRLFTFLIHAGLLDPSLLPTRSSVLAQAIQQAPTELHAGMGLLQASQAFVRHLSLNTSLLLGALKVYYYHLSAFARWRGPDSTLRAVCTQDIRDYLQFLEQQRRYVAVSRAGVLCELRSFFGFLVSAEVLKTNPTTGLRVKKTRKRPPAALSEEELTQVLSAAYLRYRRFEQTGPRRGLPRCLRWLAARDWAIVSLLITSGIRTKEIMSMSTNAVDLRARLIRISGKGDRQHAIRQRIIPLREPFTLAALESYLRLRPRSLSPHLFLNYALQPLGHTGFTKILRTVAAQAGIHRRLTITEIRKAFSSLCAHKGIDPLLLRQLMGHSSLVTTMKYYLSVQKQQLKELWENNNPLRYFSPQECKTWIL
jgi:site-specific recombinase XerD